MVNKKKEKKLTLYNLYRVPMFSHDTIHFKSRHGTIRDGSSNIMLQHHVANSMKHKNQQTKASCDTTFQELLCCKLNESLVTNVERKSNI